MSIDLRYESFDLTDFYMIEKLALKSVSQILKIFFIYFHESHLKIMKIDFDFMLKALSVLEIFTFWS